MAKGDGRIGVLVVDDQDMFAEAVLRALTDEADIDALGWAPTAAMALARVREQAPDVVLMDFGLPDVDGATAAAQIHAERPDVKVVMLTSFDDDTTLVRAIEAGCSAFITKNRAVRDLVAAVRSAHAGESLLSASTLSRLLPRVQRSGSATDPGLTPREREILDMLAQGVSNIDIAERLTLSRNTVRNHVQAVLTKLQAHSKLEAVANAVRLGVIQVR